MGRITSIVVGLCALGALAGCAGGHGSRPPSNHAELDMYDRQPSRARTARAARTKPPQNEVVTVGSTAAASGLRRYSPEWWIQERAREKQENERVERAMQICRGC
jgi:hypothetical protein